MTGADDERPGRLRIGGWLPPEGQPAPQAAGVDPVADPPAHAPDPRSTSPTLTAPHPAASALDPPVPRQFRPVRAATWIPPATAPPLGEQPAHRRGKAGPAHPSRPRTALLVVLAAAASVPLVLGLASIPTGPDRQTLPDSAVPITPGTPPEETAPPSTATATGTPTGSSAPTLSVSGAAAGAGPVDPVTAAPSVPSAPSAVPVSISIEAEGPSAVRSGQVEPRELPAASGGMVITGIGDGAANLVRFAVTVPQAGTYTVTFHYVATERLRARVTVGMATAVVQFPATGATWGTLGAASVKLPLAAGPNAIEFGNRNAPAPDLDRMVVTS